MSVHHHIAIFSRSLQSLEQTLLHITVITQDLQLF